MNDFPSYDVCPGCKRPAHGNLHRNGYYWRYGITDEVTLRIPICRLKCLNCEVNISILPDFLIPYFQHTIHTVIKRLKQIHDQKRLKAAVNYCGFILIVTIGELNGFIASLFN